MPPEPGTNGSWFDIEGRGKFLPRWYHLSSTHGPALTVCLLIDHKFVPVSRGVSIRSLLDNPCRKTGRNKSLGRAVKALIHQGTGEEIHPRPPVRQGKSEFSSHNKFAIKQGFLWKSEYMPYLHPYELTLLEAACKFWKGRVLA